MSTRRARIKAVASLPVRRKNNETSEKAKPSTPKQGVKTGPSIVPTKTNVDQEKKDIDSPSETKAVQTPKRGRRSSVQTPKSQERAPSTPKIQLKPPASPKLQQKIPSTSKIQEKQPPASLIQTPTTPKLLERSVATPKIPEKVPPIPRSRKSSTPQRVASPLVKSQNSVIKPVALITNLNNVDSNMGFQNKHQTIPITISVNNLNRSIIEPKDIPTQAKTNPIPSMPEKPAMKQNKDGSDDLDGISKISYSNPPSVPESVTEDSVFDGIVPLQSTRNVPKPLDLLKNEITSENAEVLFDPIVPLPSPSKVRPKLRPVPRLAFRRNSIQGSASESEEEGRRALLSGATTPGPSRQRNDSHTSHTAQYTVPNRVRNDSVCSAVSQVTSHTQPQQTLAAAAASKDKHASKSRRTDVSRRMSALRRKQRRDNVPRDTLTMYDLIFYNPTTNPIVREEEDTAIVKDKEDPPSKPEAPESKEPEESVVDDPPEKEDAAPVPQIKLGPNGEIMLDEQSLVINQTEGPRKLSNSIVHENEWANGGRGKYTRARRTADWTDVETVRFYRALAAVGTDFTMMKHMFPDRSRRELKVKFKKEERINGAQVDKALRSQTEWDAIRLESEFKEERRLAAEKAEKERQAYIEQKKAEKARLKAAKEEGFRQSKASKALESSGINIERRIGGPGEVNTADDLIQTCIEAKKHAKLYKSQALASFKLMNKDFRLPLKKIPKPITPTPKITRPIPDLNPIVPNVPQNIEMGSLVVLTVNDPNEPSKKMLQTYISHGQGKLTPVALPPTLLNSVVTYMKKGTPKSTANSSPQVSSPSRPSSTASQESTRSSVIQINPSPSKRPRFDSASYTITQL